MQNSSDAVLLSRHGNVINLKLNRPKTLNAISPELGEAFLHCCREIQDDKTCRVVLISGEGRAFLAGGDLSKFYEDFASAPDIAESMIRAMNEALAILGSLEMPVVAKLNGAVAGAGVSVALSCDLAIAADDTRFSFGYSQIGASPDLGMTAMLPRVVGLRNALGIALLKETIDAARAMSLGLVNRVVPRSELDAEVDSVVAQLAEGPTVAYATTKRLLRAAFDVPFEVQLGHELAAFRKCAATGDFREGVSAFIEKRDARKFAGK